MVKAFGKEAVRDFISDRTTAQITELDAKDWDFVLNLSADIEYDAARETKLLVRKYRSTLKQLQRTPEFVKDPDVSAIDFDMYE